MKILYHHRIRSKDGQYVHLSAMVSALTRRGHKVILVGPKIIETGDFGDDGGFIARLKKTIPAWVYELMEIAYSVFALLRLVVALVRHKPDAIYERYTLHLPWSGCIRKLTGLPYLLEVNAPLATERADHDGLALQSLAAHTERWAWHGASVVMPVTDVLAQHVRASGVPDERIEVIGNGVHLEHYQDILPTSVAKEELGFDHRTTLGFTGFVREWHGLDRIIDMMAEHRDMDLHLVIAGEGPAVPALKAQAAQTGLTSAVSFLGLVARERIPRLVNAFDIALQPAVVAYASPLKLFEYMAMGRAIIAPDQPNIREYLTHEVEAELFDASRPDAMNAAILALSHDTRRRACMGEAARQRLVNQRLTWDDNAERIEALIEQLTSQRLMPSVDLAGRG